MPITPLTRPKFAQWRYDRNLTLRATADLLAEKAGYPVCSHETVRTLCLPFGDARRSLPADDVLAAIEALTDDAVSARDFQQPIRERAA
jgi:hypothetical protein